jgi:hypothetical protein
MSYFRKSRLLLTATVVAALSASVLFAAQQSSNISGLVGRTDSNLNLYVRSAAAGAAGQSSNIGGLVGRTDASLNLYVVFDPLVAQVMGPLTTVGVGTGTATATVGGTVTASVTSTCTTAVTTEEDLWTYNLPANSLAVNARGVRIRAWGTTGATANVKTVRLYFAGTVVANVGNRAANSAGWIYNAVVLRTAASAQTASGDALMTGFATEPLVSTPAGDTTTILIIKVTGQNGTAAASDICIKGVTVEAL